MIISNFSTVLKASLFRFHTHRRLMLFTGATPPFDWEQEEEAMSEVLKSRSKDWLATYTLTPVLKGKSLSYEAVVTHGEPNWHRHPILTGLFYSQANDKAQLSYKVSELVASAENIVDQPTWFLVLEGEDEQPIEIGGTVEFVGSVGVGRDVSSDDLVFVRAVSSVGEPPGADSIDPIIVPL